MTTYQIEQAWMDFVVQAQAIYPPFSDEKEIKAVLKSRGETKFRPEYSNKFIHILKSVANGWETFLKDARMIDNELHDNKTVTKILNAHGIPWYMSFDNSNGLKALKDWETEKIKATNSWDYSCPICGAVTIRDHKYDYLYRKECNGLGWKCSTGGYTHYIQAVWNPLREKFVCKVPETATPG
jgi:hypothetical protein